MSQTPVNNQLSNSSSNQTVSNNQQTANSNNNTTIPTNPTSNTVNPAVQHPGTAASNNNNNPSSNLPTLPKTNGDNNINNSNTSIRNSPGLKAQEQAQKAADLQARLNKVNNKLSKGSARSGKMKKKKDHQRKMQGLDQTKVNAGGQMSTRCF